MLKRFISLILSSVMLLCVMPVLAQGEVSVQAAIKASEEVWDSIEEQETELFRTKMEKGLLMERAYELLKAKRTTSDFSWEDEDTFTFMVGTVPCVYDYNIRKVEQSIGEEQTISYENYHETRAKGKNAFVVGPYYGVDSSFNTTFYSGKANSIVAATGGIVTVLSGSYATPQAVRNRFASNNDAVMFFDSHGTVANSTSYFCMRSSTGISSSDLSQKWAVSLGSSVYGIDGRYMTSGSTVTMTDTFCWFAICEGMKTNGICKPIMDSGAGAVYGYSQSVTFKKDYEYAGVVFPALLEGDTIGEAVAKMKAQYGNYDNYVSEHAYPVVVSVDDPYPLNPDSLQAVKCRWKLAPPVYTVVFKDWNGNELSAVNVIEGQAATAPTPPPRTGYVFTGWDQDITCVYESMEVTALYDFAVPTANDPQYVIENCNGISGETITVDLKIKNNPGIVAATAGVTWDKDLLQLVAVENGDVMSDSAVTFTTSVDDSIMPYQIEWSSTAATDYTSDGVMCRLTFALKDVTELSTSNIRVEPIEAYDAGANEKVIFIGQGLVDVSPVIPGDANGDGKVSTIDAMFILRKMAGWTIEFNEIAADIDGNGEITTLDAMLILRYIVGWSVEIMD